MRDDDDIVIRKADKTAAYAILDKSKYLQKIDEIVSDKKKFKQISKNPTSDLKKKVNKLIAAANAEIGGVQFQQIIGEYQPGYLYGNVKVHNEGNPLRPIISQIPTPTYDIAKRLNDIIIPYIPVKNTLRSTEEFLTVLKCNETQGVIASLDVSSLFTNVPVKDTVEIILGYVYENSEHGPPRLPRNLLRQLLLTCTTEAPFRAPDDRLYLQVDGVAMGSPLGVLFANAYMCHIEEQVLAGVIKAPHIYKRYVDDIFLVIDSEDDLKILRDEMQKTSVLKFTYELGVEGKLPFLDVLVDNSSGRTETSVHRKKTDGGRCLNALSECPQRYRRGVIRSYVWRALKTCSSWKAVHLEINFIKQMLVNNNYSIRDIDAEIKTALDKHMTSKPNEKRGDAQKIKLYYKNTMTTAYKEDERILKDIIKRNVIPKTDAKIELRIYYSSRRTSNMIMRNNTQRKYDPKNQRSLPLDMP